MQEINGDVGDDIILGILGDENDLYDGGEGNDILTYETATTSVIVDLQTGIVQNTNADEDNILNIENILGGQESDTISGSDEANLLNGLAGDDVIQGREGNDTLEGREGNDTLFGDRNNDILTGGAGNDLLQGGTGIDVLEGNEGDDTLSGGIGSDLLRGGSGNDTYTLTLADAVGDIIQDTEGINSIELFTREGIMASLSLSNPRENTIGLTRMETVLVIDINQDGVIDRDEDLSILDFFNESGTGAGDGFMENIANLSGIDIINFGFESNSGEII